MDSSNAKIIPTFKMCNKLHSASRETNDEYVKIIQLYAHLWLNAWEGDNIPT